MTERGDPLAGIESGTLAPAGVRAMFDRIAPVYDVMNHVMTAGLDRRWRRETAEAVVRPGDRVLDACCGTGDLALACVRAGAGSVVGLDFSPRMIERARRKSDAVAWVEGDALSLPFDEGPSTRPPSASASATSPISAAALTELARVLVPGGRLGILEITQPTGALAPFYRVWFERIVPVLGRPLTGGAAYKYLPASVRRFPGKDDLVTVIGEAGFRDVAYRTFAGGIVALHTAVRE